MYPFASVPENLAAFCARLRQAYGFRIGSGELHDAARALEIVGLSDERAVRHALRPVVSGTLDEARVFDRAFTEFFFPPLAVDRAVADATREAGPAPRVADSTAPGSGLDATAASDAGAARSRDVPIASFDAIADEPSELTHVARSSYSPLDADGTDEAPLLPAADAAWRAAARSLVRRLQLSLSRRWRSARRGRRFDLRRTLRASLQTGGEPLAAKWLRRSERAPQFVLLVDGSRSMGPDALAALRAGVALATATARLEVFTFSTALQRITGDVRRAAAGDRRHITILPHAWGGGTSIGLCLSAFVRRFGARMLGHRTVVVIASDGLDVGEPELLRDTMREVYRRSAAVVWLNPCLDTPGYEPTASGMRAARPYITTLSSVTDAASLARLARVVRTRA